jgi:tetratricopeptide (TPR) repeat protein
VLLLACSGPDDHLERGRVALSGGDATAAAQEFSRAIEKDPERADAWIWRAKVRLQTGATADALDDLRRAIEIDPGAWEAWRLLGEHDITPENRIAALDRVLALRPEDVEVHLLRARDQLAAGNPDGAGDDLETYLTGFPNDQRGWKQLADVRLAQDRPYEAHDAFSKGVSPAANQPRALHVIKVRARSGDIEAREYLRSVGETDEPYLEIASRLYEAGRVQLAMEAARKAAAVHREDPVPRARALAYSASARALLVTDQTFAGTRGAATPLERERVLKEAIRECEESLEVEPSALCYRTIGYANYELGRHARAISSLGQALELKPDDHKSRWRRARAAYERERWDLVIEDVDALEEAGEASVDALVLRGKARRQHPELPQEQALADFDKAVALALRTGSTSPGVYTAFKERGLHYADTMRYELAYGDLQRAKEMRSIRDEEVEYALLEVVTQLAAADSFKEPR